MAHCFECGNVADHDHHVVPRSLGGTKTVPLCGVCHGKVHDLDFTDHRALTRTALVKKKLRNERIGVQPEYGFRVAADGIHIEEDETEQAIISRMRALAGGRSVLQARRLESGLSYAKISRALAAEGLLNRAGKPFARQAIHLLLAEQS